MSRNCGPGCPAELIPRSAKIKGVKNLKYLQWVSVEDLQNHEELVCTNHDEVHKSEADPPP